LHEHIKSGAKSYDSLRRIHPGTRLKLFVVLGLQNLATTVKTVGADVMATMRFTGGRLNCDRWRHQEVVRTMHAALGRGFLVLLNSHDNS
jgi:hypothetical protein